MDVEKILRTLIENVVADLHADWIEDSSPPHHILEQFLSKVISNGEARGLEFSKQSKTLNLKLSNVKEAFKDPAHGAALGERLKHCLATQDFSDLLRFESVFGKLPDIKRPETPPNNPTNTQHYTVEVSPGKKDGQMSLDAQAMLSAASKSFTEHFEGDGFKMLQWSSPLDIGAKGIPIGTDGRPSLLLADLGHLADLDPALEKCIGDLLKSEHTITWYINTTGSGKTKVAIEALCRVFGLYLSFEEFMDINRLSVTPLGPKHLSDAMSSLGKKEYFTANPKQYENQKERFGVNIEAVRKLMGRVMFAHLLLFESFLTAAKNSGIKENLAKQWMITQLQPQHILRRDIFLLLSREFQNMDVKVIFELANEVRENVHNLMAQLSPGPYEHSDEARSTQQLYVVFDECQHPGTQYEEAFSSQDGESRPVLKAVTGSVLEILNVPLSRVILTGTGLNVRKMKEATASSAGKGRVVGLKTNTGIFQRDKLHARYIIRYLWPDQNLSPNQWTFVSRMLTYFGGRHRFTASVIEDILMGSKSDDPNDHLDRAYYELTGVWPLDGGPSSNEDIKPRDTDKRDLISDKIKDYFNENPRQRADLGVALQQFMLRGSIIETNDVQAVELGIARYMTPGKDLDQCRIDETISLVALTKYYQSNYPWEEELIRDMSRGKDIQGEGYENIVTYQLMQHFARERGSKLSDVFHFHIKPEWADWTAQLVVRNPLIDCLPSGIKTVDNFNLLPQWLFPTDTRVPVQYAHSTSTREETLSWLKCRQYAPILLPDRFTYPDHIAFLSLTPPNMPAPEMKEGDDPHIIILADQAKAGEHFTKSSYGQVFHSLRPTEWYKNNAPNARDNHNKMKDILKEQYNISVADKNRFLLLFSRPQFRMDRGAVEALKHKSDGYPLVTFKKDLPISETSSSLGVGDVTKALESRMIHYTPLNATTLPLTMEEMGLSMENLNLKTSIQIKCIFA